jgi:hypothetical protein
MHADGGGCAILDLRGCALPHIDASCAVGTIWFYEAVPLLRRATPAINYCLVLYGFGLIVRIVN